MIDRSIPQPSAAATVTRKRAIARRLSLLSALAFALLGGTPAWAQPVCKPAMAFTDAHYAAMQLPKLERTWTVAFTVDASRCKANSGTFAIQFTVQAENAPDFEVVETFSWQPDLNVISRQFWADEAVGAYRVAVAPCPCRN